MKLAILPHARTCITFTENMEPVLLQPPSTSEAAGARRRPPVAIGIVCMTKQPLDLRGWLEYHHSACVGVQRFFLRIEDTPELKPLLAEAPWASVVDATFVSTSGSTASGRDYVKQMQRQNDHTNAAIAKCCKGRGSTLTHLLHIDDDELLYCHRGPATLRRVLAAAPTSACDVHVRNVEAAPPRPDCGGDEDAPFGSIRLFRHDPKRFGAYNNGKSFGRLAAPRLRASGPRLLHFDGAGERHTLPPWAAVILHFEACIRHVAAQV